MEIFDILFYNILMKRFLITTIILLSGLNLSVQAATFPWQKPVQQEEIDTASEHARVLYAQNNIDEALKILTEKGEDTRSAEDWLLIGNIMQDKEKISEAEFAYQKAIIKSPKYYKAYYNLGYIYLAQNRPNLALEYFKKSVKYNPDFAYGYYNIGCAYLQLKEYRNARYNFFKALDLKPDEAMIYYNLSYTFKMLKNEKQAQTYLDLYNKLIER